MKSTPALHVVMYHYLRDFRRTRFPAIKGMELEEFRVQVTRLRGAFEMATVESALAFVRGDYHPARDLCLLTFDDGLKEHFTSVMPILADQRIQGVFFLVTSCLEDARVASVHRNHFLMAHLGPEKYCRVFEQRLGDLAPELLPMLGTGGEPAKVTYPWDTPEIARFKYFFNFVLDTPRRDRLAATLFSETFGSETAFARELYLSWEEARAMQGAGMAMGGHTDAHRALATMEETELAEDLSRCRALLDRRLQPQTLWPFSYPYGKNSSYTPAATARLRDLRFDCAFSTEAGPNGAGSDLYGLRRVDCKRAPV